MLLAMGLPFTKMHGVGNDFIVFDAPSDAALPSAAALRHLADRHSGIGFDQAKTRPYSNGLINIKKRMTDIGGVMEIENKNGTLVKLKAPLA